MGTGSLSRAYSDQGVALTTHPNFSAEVKERVEVYFSSPLGLYCLFYGVLYHFTCNTEGFWIAYSVCGLGCGLYDLVISVSIP